MSLKTKASGKLESGVQVEVDFEIEVGKDLDEAVELFGVDAVYDRYRRSAVIEAQGRARQLLTTGGKTPEEVASYMKSWVPGASIVNAEANFLQAFDKMSPEEQAAAIQKLKEKAGL